MRLSVLFWRTFVFLLPPTIISTIALYLYPVISGCAFPQVTRPAAECVLDKNVSSAFASIFDSPGKPAPFRLLALGDPQLEGDTSLPTSDELSFPSIRRWRNAEDKLGTVGKSLTELLLKDIPAHVRYYHKQLDLLGNDYYLAHIYRTLNWWTAPTHVVVAGDLLGSQWLSDDEFSRRSWRYWNRVFRNGRRVEDEITRSDHTAVLGADKAWSRRIINVAGNHDIGYAGDINRHRLDRFEREFGPVNWDVNFQLPRTAENSSLASSTFAFGAPPSLRLVILNDMNLDSPARDDAAQLETYQYMNDLISKRLNPVEDKTSAVLLLTHIPLYKEAGVCSDGPFFSYRDTGIEEQNHLSQGASAGILEGIFGKSNKYAAAANGRGRQGLIINGHDHTGCDVYHHTSPPPQQPPDAEADAQGTIDIQKDFKWDAQRWSSATHLIADEKIPGIREMTLRSMMGSYGGHAGLISAWYDEDESRWHFEPMSCPAGPQQIWWGVHILDLVMLLLLAGAGISNMVEATQVNIQPADSASQGSKRSASSTTATKGARDSKTTGKSDKSVMGAKGSTGSPETKVSEQKVERNTTDAKSS